MQLAAAVAAAAASLPWALSVSQHPEQLSHHFSNCFTFHLANHDDHVALATLTQVRPGPEWQQAFESAVSPDRDRKDRYLHPDLLLVNAVISNCPGKARLVEILLQRGVALEGVKPQNGETALTMAVMQGDVQVRPLSCGA